jgi:hypothetical protein
MLITDGHPVPMKERHKKSAADIVGKSLKNKNRKEHILRFAHKSSALLIGFSCPRICDMSAAVFPGQL